MVSVVLLSISIYSLMGMFGEELKDRQNFKKLQEIYKNTDAGEDVGAGTDASETAGDDEAETLRPVNAGLLALHEENPDCIAWIKIEDTAIDYPIMYRPTEKNYYLHRDFHGEYSASGSLFLSEICDPKLSDNWIVYGHHMNSGTMFAALEKYKNQSFYEEHPIITLSTLQGDEQYQIIAAFALSINPGNDFPYYAFHKAETALEYQKYVLECQQRSYYQTGETAVYGDRLLTLSTCEYSHRNGRMVVVAKRLSEGGD